jgi:hypothetical protein
MNKDEYITLWLTFKLRGRIEAQLKALASGFYSRIPVTEIQNFTVDELGLLIFGVPGITFSVFSDNSDSSSDYVAPETAGHSVIKMVFQAVSGWNSDDPAQLLLVATRGACTDVVQQIAASKTRSVLGHGAGNSDLISEIDRDINMKFGIARRFPRVYQDEIVCFSTKVKITRYILNDNSAGRRNNAILTMANFGTVRAGNLPRTAAGF